MSLIQKHQDYHCQQAEVVQFIKVLLTENSLEKQMKLQHCRCA